MRAASGFVQREAGLIGHQEQTLPQLQEPPADPVVTGGAVQGGGMAADPICSLLRLAP